MGDYRQPAWGSAGTSPERRIFGSKAWSTADKDEWFRLQAHEDAAEAYRTDLLDELADLQDRMGDRFGQDRKWNHETWPPFEKSEYVRLMREASRFGEIARQIAIQQSALSVALDQKYATARTNKKAIAEEAAAAGPMEQLALLPPRGPGSIVPGGTVYQEAAASARGEGLGGRRRPTRPQTKKAAKKTCYPGYEVYNFRKNSRGVFYNCLPKKRKTRRRTRSS
jgi:hypothetical protein